MFEFLGVNVAIVIVLFLIVLAMAWIILPFGLTAMP